jgi:hypothetical protein
MDRNLTVHQLADEIEQLAKMHILYGLDRTPQFAMQKERISQLILSQRIHVRTELDPVSRNLYGRYFS